MPFNRAAPEPTSTSAVLALCVFGLVATVRLSYPGAVELHSDDSRILGMAWQIREGIEFPSLGPAIRAVYGRLGPATLYLVAGALRLWPSPQAAVVMISLLWLVGLWALYRTCVQAFGANMALYSVALYGGSLINTIQTRRINNFSFAQPLVILLFFFLFKMTTTRDSRHLPAAVFFWCLALQAHLATAFAIVPLAVALTVVKPKRRDVLLSVLVGIALFSPVIAYELRTGFANTTAMLSIAGAQAGAEISPLRTLGRYFWVVSYIDAYPTTLLDWANALASKGEVVLLTAGLAVLIRRIADRRYPKTERLLQFYVLLWFTIPLVLLMMYRAGEVADYYLILSFPSHFLIMAMLLATLAKRLRPRGIVTATIALLFCLQVGFLLHHHRAISTTGHIASGVEFEIPLGHLTEIAQYLSERFGVSKADVLTPWWSATGPRAHQLHGLGTRLRIENLPGLLEMKNSWPEHLSSQPEERHIIVSRHDLDPATYPDAVEVPPYTIASFVPRMQPHTWRFAATLTPQPEDWQTMPVGPMMRRYAPTQTPAWVFEGKFEQPADAGPPTVFVQASSFVTAVWVDGNAVLMRPCQDQSDRSYKLKEVEIPQPHLNPGTHTLRVVTSECGYSLDHLPNPFFFDAIIATLGSPASSLR